MMYTKWNWYNIRETVEMILTNDMFCWLFFSLLALAFTLRVCDSSEAFRRHETPREPIVRNRVAGTE